MAKRKQNRKSRSKKRTPYRQNVRPVGNWSLICPDVQRVKLRYTDIVRNLTQASPAYVYRLNSMFDPNLTGAGSQPVGFDEWCAFYEQYRVYGCKVTVEATPLTSGMTSFARIAMWPTNNSTTNVVTLEDALDQRFVKSCIVTGSNATGYAKMESYYSCGKIIGTKTKYDDNQWSAITTNPLRQAILHLFAGSVDGASQISISVRVSLTYYAEMAIRKDIKQS